MLCSFDTCVGLLASLASAPVRGSVRARKKAAKTPAAALERAKKHFERASEDPDDADGVFVWSFYALENAVVAAALHAGAEFQRNHWTKFAAAHRLSQRHGLEDVSSLLSDLNEARKGTAYGDVEEPDIEPADVLEQVGDYLKEVEAFLKKKLGK